MADATSLTSLSRGLSKTHSFPSFCRYLVVEIIVVIYSLQLAICVVSGPERKCPSLPGCRCNNDVTVVDCSYGQLTYIPNIPESALVLNLEHNNLTSITSRAFSKLLKLQTLNLNYNSIQKVEPFAFEGLESTTKIQMRKNKMRALENQSFANIPRLQNLTLAYNMIEYISEHAFDGTSAITKIVLDGNKFFTVPSVGYQPQLTWLHLFTNVIVNATFPSSYRNGSKRLLINLSEKKIASLDNYTLLSLAGVSITDMVLTNDYITTIADGTFTPFSLVESLKLGSNPLSISSVRNIAFGPAKKSLTYLDLSGVFDSEKEFYEGLSFFKNTSITTLELCRNSISFLTDELFNEFQNVQVLHLCKNKLFQLGTETLRNLHELIEIGSDNNMFMSFPRHLPTSLKGLNLAGNQIKVIKTNDTSYLHNLRSLSLNNNGIGKLESGAFNGLENLNTLYLSQNHIGVLSGSIFQPLRNLTHLYLGNNNLHQIFQILFEPLASLRKLDLSGNGCCDRMQVNTFESLTSLRYLHLERNNLSDVFAGKYGSQLFKGLTELKEIHISSNNIQTVSNSLLKDQVSLGVLKMDHNRISGWGPDTFKFTKNLTTLDIRHNQIAVLSEDNLHDLNNLEEIDLKDNPFVCSCDLLWFRGWIDRTTVLLPGKESYKCTSPEGWRGKPLVEFTKDKINCTVVLKYVPAIVGSISGALLISLLSGMLVYRNRWRIRLRLYLLSKRGRLFLRNLKAQAQRTNYGSINDDNDQVVYDAYISCSEYDNDWVLQHLLPGIDDGRYDDENLFGGEFKLYHDPRDFDPG